MTDGELVRRALRGQQSAFAVLAERWAARVLAVCRSRVGRSDVAEDLAQETLLRAFRSLSTLSDAERFGPWLRGIADRAALDWLKSSQRRQVPFSVVASGGRLDEPVIDETDVPESNEEAQRLRAAVESLSEDLREVVMLFYFDRLTYDELASVLGVARATVSARLARARQVLRQRLSQREVKS